MAQMIRVTPVVGLPQFTGWAHVLELTLDANTKCVICFSISGENSSNIGRDVIQTISHMPPRSAQGLYESIEECLTIVQEQQGYLALAAGIFRYSRSVLAVYNGSVVLKRNQKVGKLLQAGEDIKVVEGKYQQDDVFVFASQQAEEFLSQIEINFQRGFDSDGVITAIVPALHSLEDSSTSALAFIAMTEEDPVVVKPPLAQLEIDFQPQSSPQQPERLVSVEVASNSEQEVEASALPTSESLLPQRPTLATATALPLLRKLFDRLSMLGKASVAMAKKFIASLRHIPRLFSKKTYLDSPTSKKTMRIVTVAIIGIVLIAAVVVMWQRQAQRNEAAALGTAAPFRQQLASAHVLAQSDPITAREQVARLMDSIKAAQSEAETSGQKRTSEELQNVLVEARTIFQEISGQDEVSELPIFYDLRLVSTDFISTKTAISESQAIFLDAEKKQAIVLDVQTKQVFQLHLAAIDQVRSMAVMDNSTLILLANGLYTMALSEGAEPVEVKSLGDSNRSASLTGAFSSYVYVFNAEKRNIYRYAPSGTTLSDPIGWLQDPLGVPFESVASWAIDGDIWIGTQTGQLLRFASGRSTKQSVVGLPEPLASALYISTRENLENVYILEPQKSRLVVLTKDGRFLREVKSSSLGAATSVLINSSGDKAYVVSGSTVYELAV